MKKFILGLCLSLACLNVEATYASSNENSVNKFYISSKDLLIGDNGIFVKIDQTIIPVETITHEGEGVYAVMGGWTCPQCWHFNSCFEVKCGKCDFSNAKKKKNEDK